MKLEEQAAIQNAASASSIIGDELERMDGTANDWAAWTETYEFVIGNDPGYPGVNLSASTFEHLNLNVFLFVDTAGRVAYSQGYDLLAAKAAPVHESLKSLAASDKSLLARMLAPAGVRGIIIIGGEPMLAAIRPVIRSDYSGPPAGALITAKYLDNAQISRLSAKLGQAMSVYPASDSQAAESAGKNSGDSARPAVMQAIVRQEGSVSGFASLPDITGRRTLIVQVDIPRTSYFESRSNIYLFILALLSAVVIFSLLTILLLERLILSRLLRLTKRVKHIGERGVFGERVEMGGRDEVAVLSAEINRMLSALAESHEALRENELVRRQFFEGASHELKTPLTALLGMVETLQRGAGDEETRSKYLGRIREQSLRIAALVNDLLALSHLDTGAGVLKVEQVDLCEALSAAVDNARAIASGKGLSLATIHPGSPVMVNADREALSLIVGNLLDNAVKYTLSGGSVRMSCREEGGFAVLEVSDTGIGIAPADQLRIFDRFYRTDRARSRELGGTGLGLSIVKEMVSLQGGKVLVSSKPGEGSTFVVYIPSAPKEG